MEQIESKSSCGGFLLVAVLGGLLFVGMLFLGGAAANKADDITGNLAAREQAQVAQVQAVENGQTQRYQSFLAHESTMVAMVAVGGQQAKWPDRLLWGSIGALIVLVIIAGVWWWIDRS